MIPETNIKTLKNPIQNAIVLPFFRVASLALCGFNVDVGELLALELETMDVGSDSILLPKPCKIRDARFGLALLRSDCVLEPMTIWDSPGARDTGRPEIEIGGPPGTRVCPAIRYSDVVVAR